MGRIENYTVRRQNLRNGCPRAVPYCKVLAHTLILFDGKVQAEVNMRIQPASVQISDDPAISPFANDRLERKESAEVLTRIVSQIEGPCVMALDADWGYGKTTFLNMWTQWLRHEGFPVVAFNAWETDFTRHPLLALTSELTRELESFTKVSAIPELLLRRRVGIDVQTFTVTT